MIKTQERLLLQLKRLWYLLMKQRRFKNGSFDKDHMADKIFLMQQQYQLHREVDCDQPYSRKKVTVGSIELDIAVSDDEVLMMKKCENEVH